MIHFKRFIITTLTPAFQHLCITSKNSLLRLILKLLNIHLAGNLCTYMLLDLAKDYVSAELKSTPLHDSFHLQSSQIYDPHPICNLGFPSHLISITTLLPACCPDFRHGFRPPAVHLWPPDLDGGALLWQQALPGVGAELPEVIGERHQPPLLHLSGSSQF